MSRLKIIDVTGSVDSKPASQEKLPEEFGKNLGTIARARQWLTSPHNWFEGQVYIVKWNGLIPTVCSAHGRRLLEEPWDNDLPGVVVREQNRLKAGGKQDKFEDLVERD